jgi:hypothetical protein
VGQVFHGSAGTKSGTNHHIALFQYMKHLGNLSWIMREVSIHEYQDIAGRPLDASPD